MWEPPQVTGLRPSYLLVRSSLQLVDLPILCILPNYSFGWSFLVTFSLVLGASPKGVLSEDCLDQHWGGVLVPGMVVLLWEPLLRAGPCWSSYSLSQGGPGAFHRYNTQHQQALGLAWLPVVCGFLLWLICFSSPSPLSPQIDSQIVLPFSFFNICSFIIGCAESLLLYGLSLVVESGAYSLVVVHRLLIAWLHLQSTGSRAHGLQLLQLMGLAAPRHVVSSQTRDQTSVPRIPRRILIHWTIREDLQQPFNSYSSCHVLLLIQSQHSIALIDYFFRALLDLQKN